MATATLTIKNGQIVSYRDRYFGSLSENKKEYHGNGWIVKVLDGRKDRPGRIICHAEREYSDGPAVCHREFKLADGTLGLAGGNIYSRYAYFRSEDFQKFLSKFGITAVKREDPNQQFSGFSVCSGCGTSSQNVWSDGEIEKHEVPGERPNTFHTVSNATWAIVENKRDYKDDHNYSVILYTTVKNVISLEKSLMAHPEIGPKAVLREKENRIWALEGTLVESLADVKAIVEKACQIPGIEDTYDRDKVAKFMSDRISNAKGETPKFEIHTCRGIGYSNFGIIFVTVSCIQHNSIWETEPIAKGKVS